MARSLSLDTILDMVLEATLVEAGADVATLTLKNLQTGEFVERTRKYSKNAQTDLNWYGSHSGVGELNLTAIVEQHRQERPLLARHPRPSLLRRAAQDKRLVSFCSIPLKVKDNVIGMLNAYSYTRGYKFSGDTAGCCRSGFTRGGIGKRPSLRRACRVERRAQEGQLDAARASRATIVGFARALEESIATPAATASGSATPS